MTWQGQLLDTLLEKRFSISTGFHPGQRDIIEQLIQGKRILAIQRTGWGKSLCYQMASLFHPHLTLVFSPLKALMRDQCLRCNNMYEIPSAVVSSDFSDEENRTVLEQAIAGNLKLLFIAPERMDNLDWQAYVSKMKMSMLVIDEAHCISTWGHDFRPHYRRIRTLLGILPQKLPILALTATANRRVERDILQQMGIGVQVKRGTMQRPNLYLDTVVLRGGEEKLYYLSKALQQWPGTGILYTATRASAEMVAAFLCSQGIDAIHYHAGLEDGVRQDVERKWMHNQYKVVCSTNALGMGIDKPDVRFVVHYHMPASPIHYYQEMGRAGRDGQVAYCTLLYDSADATIQEYFIRTARPEGKSYELVLSLLRVLPQGMYDLMRATGLSQKAISMILADLEEQRFIQRHPKDRTYRVIGRLTKVNFSDYDAVRMKKQHELEAMQNYVHYAGCYMGYLTEYLGDPAGYRCGVCGHCAEYRFPGVASPERIPEEVTHFLEKEFLPRIEKRGTHKQPIHEAGWSLSYHGDSLIGKLVRASKYEGAGPFAQELVVRAAEVIQTRYPIATIDGIVSVPPTRSGLLVEGFARQVADLLGKEYLPLLVKVRPTQEQKILTNHVQKADNVKGAFSIMFPVQIVGRVLLLIDDIYDSGYMLREVAQTLMRAGAKVVYPFTITRTIHSDDQ